MMPKTKKEVLTPYPSTDKALKVKKAVLKGIHSNQKKRITQGTWTQKAAQISSEEHLKRNNLDHYAIISITLTTESAMKKIENNNTVVFIVDVKINNHQIRQAVRKLYDIAMAKVNVLIRPYV